MSIADEYWPSASSPVTFTACVFRSPRSAAAAFISSA